jgi:hypothetical protein
MIRILKHSLRRAPRRTRPAPGHHHLRPVRNPDDRALPRPPRPPAPRLRMPAIHGRARSPDLPGPPRGKPGRRDRPADDRRPHPAGRRSRAHRRSRAPAARRQPPCRRRRARPLPRRGDPPPLPGRRPRQPARRRHPEADWNTALRALNDANDACDKAQNTAPADLAEAQKPASARWSPTSPRSGTTRPPRGEKASA